MRKGNDKFVACVFTILVGVCKSGKFTFVRRWIFTLILETKINNVFHGNIDFGFCLCVMVKSG